MKNIARFLTTFLTGVLFSVSTALATEVDTVDFQEDYNGYPCFLSMKSENGGNLTFQLSDYKDIWRLNLVVSNRALVFQDFFNNQGRYKVDEFSRTFTKVVLDGKEFRFQDIQKDLIHYIIYIKFLKVL